MNLFTESDHVYLMTLCKEQPIIPKLFKGPPTQHMKWKWSFIKCIKQLIFFF